MPALIKMRLSNGNNTVHQMRDISKAIKLTPIPKPEYIPANTSLSTTSMITRVHNVKPGCGSCGRH